MVFHFIFHTRNLSLFDLFVSLNPEKSLEIHLPVKIEFHKTLFPAGVL